jgi:ABC-2 type transport system permease protein
VNDAGVLATQVAYEQRSYWRNPAAAGFGFLFPIILLVIFGSTNQHAVLTSLGHGKVSFDQYFTPDIVAFGIMGVCFTNLAINLSFRREQGILKRVRGTPLPPWAYLGGLVGNAVIVCLILTALVIGIGMAAYGVTFPGHTAALLVSLVVGAATFCCLGLAMTTFIPNADAAPAIANIVFFPLVAVSGAFYPISGASFLSKVADVFPLKHFIDATFSSFDPRVHGSGFRDGDLLNMGVWAAAGLFIALRRFQWEPRVR